MSIPTTRKMMLVMLAGLIAALAVACGESDDSPPEGALDRAVLQVREHLATQPVEGNTSNPSCLFLVERDGPRSVQWVAEESAELDNKIVVEARKGGLPVRGFSWLWDWKTTEVTSNSTSTLC